MEENPDYLPPYSELARIYLADKKVDQAIAQYKTVLGKDPNQAGAHMMLGTIYDMEKKTDISEKHYRSALEINPDFAPAANNLAYILASRDDSLNEAFGLVQIAKEKFPNNPSIMDTLGWVYFKKDLYDNAIGEFTGAIEKLPDNATVRYHLGMAYHKKGENEKAKETLEKALSLNDSFEGAEEAKQILEEL